MKKIHYVCVLLCLLSDVLLAQDYYPLCAFHVKNTLWFKGAGKDSLGLNMIDYEEQVNSATQQQILDAADRESLKVILRHATKSSGGMTINNIEWYCRLHSGQWEAESSCFYHGVGQLVADPQAPSNGYAWKAELPASADTMLKGPNDRFRNHLGYKWMDVVFYLKVDSLGLDTVRVCSLSVTKRGDTLVAQKVLRVSDFDSINYYQPCTLSANCPYDASVLNYWIYWYGNRNLWCDQVVSKDRYIDSLRAGVYNPILWDITSIFNSDSALVYYYLLDEPYISYFAANAYVMYYLVYGVRSGHWTFGFGYAANCNPIQSPTLWSCTALPELEEKKLTTILY